MRLAKRLYLGHRLEILIEARHQLRRAAVFDIRFDCESSSCLQNRRLDDA